jgi:hypothetical protein
LVECRKTSEWARIRSEWIYPLRAKRFDPITIVIALVTVAIAASVVKKLGLMALREISNSQEELIRLMRKS